MLIGGRNRWAPLLPLYVSAVPAELAGFPAVLVALIGYTHEAGRLNAKRRDRLIAEVETLRPQFEAAMTSQRRVTWARLYGQLLRAEGVHAADPQAVGAWVDALARRSYPQRRAELGLEALGGSGAGESGGVAPSPRRRSLGRWSASARGRPVCCWPSGWSPSC